jgi:hypothetical protein
MEGLYVCENNPKYAIEVIIDSVNDEYSKNLIYDAWAIGVDMAKVVITIEDGDEPGSVKLGIDMPKLNPMAEASTLTPAQQFAVEVLEICGDIKRREEER